MVACRAKRITDDLFLKAAKILADQVTESDLSKGRVYPPLARIRDVSLEIATAVSEIAYEKGLARNSRPSDFREYIRSRMYDPRYEVYV